MEKIINEKKYYIPSHLTSEQKNIYCHVIDWKREHITAERGVYKGYEYDAILPEGSLVSAMIYKPIIPQLEKMQQGDFKYKLHKFANHAVSSQTACLNLFMPLLLSDEVSKIIPMIPGCPLDFKEIAKDKLFNGFCFEYWGQDIKRNKGLLNDHSKQAGTDADVAIAYYNIDGKLCLWLIEHKLSEKEFTQCGAYKSKANNIKENCNKCSLASIANEIKECYYRKKGYKYWSYFSLEKHNNTDIIGCPFRGGLNQLWRNQMLAFALQGTDTYQTVKFSVCHHAKNTMLEHSINQYKALIRDDNVFSSFTNYDILNVINTNNSELRIWKEWYSDVYCF